MPAFDLFSDTLAETFGKLRTFTLDNYARLATDFIYLESFLSSLWIAAVSTALSLGVGYPLALAMARAPRRMRPALLMFVMLPFFTSFLIRIYAWIGSSRPRGCSTMRSWGSASPMLRSGFSRPTGRSTSGSSTATCRSWSCRSMPAWKRPTPA